MSADIDVRKINEAQDTIEKILSATARNLSLVDLKKQLNIAEKIVENTIPDTAIVMIKFVKIIKAELKNRDEEGRKH